MRVERQTVDLTAYPDLVIIYLGMRVRRPRGALRLFGLGPQIQKSWKAKPDGLLLHEDMIWSLFPLHLGMRQYWRDLDSLERWTRSEPHRRWWQQFLKDSGGTGFWHEAYFMRGGIDAVYADMAKPTGIARFAPATPARGAMFSARHRAGRDGQALTMPPVVSERGVLRSGRHGRAERPRSRAGRLMARAAAEPLHWHPAGIISSPRREGAECARTIAAATGG